MKLTICKRVFILVLIGLTSLHSQTSYSQEPKERIPALIQSLSDKDPKVRIAAADALRELGPPIATASLPRLQEGLKDVDDTVRNSIKRALVSMGASAVPFLVDTLSFRAAEARLAAVEALGEMSLKSVSTPAIPALIRALKDENDEVRKASVVSLYGRRSRIVIYALIEVVKSDRNRSVQERAVMVLGNLGPRAAVSIPAIIAFMKEAPEYSYIYENTPTALASIGAEAIPELIKVLKDSKVRYVVRSTAVNALRYMVLHNQLKMDVVPEVVNAIPTLVELLADKDEELAMEAALVLAMIGPEAKAAVETLVSWSKGKDPTKRGVGAYALQKVDPNNVAGVPILLELLRHESETIRGLSAYYLGRLGMRTPDIVKALRAALKDSEPSVRMAAANALRDLEK